MPVTPSDYKLKVLLGLPFAGGPRYVPPEWAVALATIAWPMNCRYALAPAKGMPREQARTEIVERALKHRAQYVAMLDDDIQPPPDWIQALVRELDSRPEYDVISAICPSPNREPMVFAKPADGPYWHWKQGDIFEIAECATACILIRTDLFKRIPKPWFMDLNTTEECVAAGTQIMFEQDRGAMTDDIYFCQKAVAAGAKLLAHGGVLPIHWNRDGGYAELPPDSYPFTSDRKFVDDGPQLDLTKALAIPGWMSQEELEWLAGQAARVQVNRIAEIGCWHGRSTRALADNIGPDGIVYAIDTWNGPPETPDDIINVGIAAAHLPEDWALDQFRKNTAGLDGKLSIMQMSSVEAAKTVITDDGKFDLVFIDAAHDYDNVKLDIQSWLPLVRPGGIIAGHDYQLAWPGVVEAVNELLPGAKRGAGTIWYDVLPDEDE
jgi:SAM-dependent methyltransferase